MDEIRVRRLEPGDDRTAFESGDVDLDRFFRAFAGQNQFRHHVGVTYVAVREAQIVGYATVAAGAIETDRLPQRRRRALPAYPLPVLRLARLATSMEARGLGVGRLLLRFVLQMARDASASFGCVGVVVDAKPAAEGFYARYGFERIESSGILEGGGRIASASRPAVPARGDHP